MIKKGLKELAAALLFHERLTVSAFRYGRIRFMGTDLYAVQRAVVFALSIVLAGLNITVNTRIFFHFTIPPQQIKMICVRRPDHFRAGSRF